MSESTAQTIARQQAQIDRLTAQLAVKQTLTLKVSAPRAAGTFNASDKGSLGGSVSLYGLNRLPISLYAEQWERLIDFAPSIVAFIVDHPALPRKVPTATSAPAVSLADATVASGRARGLPTS